VRGTTWRSRSERRANKDQAARIRSLPKPTLPAWTLNMLSRRGGKDLPEILCAGEQAEAAQASVLAGSGNADELCQARDDLRRAVPSLASEAAEVLVRGGHAAREETPLRVARALEAAAVTPGPRQLQKGDFAQEPQEIGFDLFPQLSTSTPANTPRAAARKAARKPRAPESRRGRAEAERAGSARARRCARSAPVVPCRARGK
jgi:hypothetical protein